MNPLTIVVLGATGDLFKRKLAKAFFDLYKNKVIPEETVIIGVSRKNLSHEEFREIIEDRLEGSSRDIEEFLSRVFYMKGDIHGTESFDKIRTLLDARDDEIGVCSHKLFYLAIFPELYEEVFRNLSHSGLTLPCAPSFGSKHGSWIRVLVEKPFSTDAKNAERLDNLLGKLFLEEQIFRIDHYLAKETVQNLIAFRFGNPLFEALWSRKYIKSVRIKSFETNTVSERGNFYDKIGAIKDFGQNHLLSLLSLVGMEMPESLSGPAIQRSREKVLSHTKVFGNKIIFGQYEGYSNEDGVAENSTTETYFKADLEIRNERWRGVPFTIEHGKALHSTEGSIEIIFKEEMAEELFSGSPNKLRFHIQPSEKIEIDFFSKKTGLDFEIEKNIFSFTPKESISPFIYPYEKLLSDAILGDQTLFVSTGEMKEAWRIVSEILEAFAHGELIVYKKGLNPESLNLI